MEIEIIRVTANSLIDFELILHLLSGFRLTRAENIQKYRERGAIVVSGSFQALDIILTKYLGSVDYPYRNFQLETRKDWSSISQVLEEISQ